MSSDDPNQRDLTVAFHFNAKPGSGLGHFKRCLNLAQSFRSRGITVLYYLCTETAENLSVQGLLDGLDDKVVLSRQVSTSECTEFCNSSGVDVLLIDDYQFNVESEIDLREHVFLVMVDDHLFDHRSHIILNHRPGLALKMLTHTDGFKTLLLGGSSYCLAEATCVSTLRQPTDSLNLLLHAGGSDLYHLFPDFFDTVLRCCKSRSISVDVLCADRSAMIPPRLRKFINENKSFCKTISFDAPLREKVGYYDAVVGPAGTTTYETLIVGSLPFSFEITDDGRDSKKAWGHLGHLFHLSYSEALDPYVCHRTIALFLDNLETVVQFIEQAECRLDGRGCERAVDDILKAYDANLRGVDCDLAEFTETSTHLNGRFFEKCASSDMLGFLESRNSERSLSSSTDPTHQIHWIDHLTWWLDPRIRRYKVVDEHTQSVEGYFWIKELLISDTRYFTSGWFPSIHFDSKGGLSLGLKIMTVMEQEVQRQGLSGRWVITMRPENHFAIQSNRRFGFKSWELDLGLLDQLYPGAQAAGLLAMSKLMPALVKSV